MRIICADAVSEAEAARGSSIWARLPFREATHHTGMGFEFDFGFSADSLDSCPHGVPA
jgi:hypothetical protein